LLSKDEQITISNNLKQKTGTSYELDEIWQTWYLVYRHHYFKTALENAQNIKKQFYHYQETNELQVYIQKFNIIYVCVCVLLKEKRN